MTEVDDVKQLSRLTKLIRERRGRQENPDKTVAIFCIFIDPVTKQGIDR